jgi:PTH1 family peptidyl-tRNA hydrolase
MNADRDKKLSRVRRFIDLVRGQQESDSLPEEAGKTRGRESLVSPSTRSDATFLVAGLGNPGREYANNRHNVGFMLVDHLAARLGVQFSRVQHKALVTDSRYGGHKIILVKPQTYMNESGQSIASLVRFYKVPLENLLVVYDEMDIPLGAIRIRPKGGTGGHRGMRSIIQQLGNQQGFPRIRLGLGRPPGRLPPPAYLLQDFSTQEKETLSIVLDNAVDAVLSFVADGLETAMNLYNGPVSHEE